MLVAAPANNGLVVTTVRAYTPVCVFLSREELPNTCVECLLTAVALLARVGVEKDNTSELLAIITR